MLDQLHEEFVKRGYTWKIDGEDVVPTRQDLQDYLDAASKRLEDGMQMQSGYLIIQTVAGKTDVYLYQGEYENE